MAFPQKSFTLDEAQKRMERFCAYQERSHQEVVQKLRQMRMIPDAIDTIVVRLIESGFLSEERFALAFSRGKFRQKRWGRVRIRKELEQRNLSGYLIQKALEEIPEREYLATFDALATSRWDQLAREPDLQKRKRKFADYLLYRGWEMELIYDKLRELGGSP
jgi:regulatory protein